MSTESCSFCGKTRREVQKLIAGPAVHICNECIELCNDVLREELETWEYATLLDIGPVSPGAWSQYWDAAAQAAVIGIFRDLFVHRVVHGIESQAFCRALEVLSMDDR